MTRKTVLATLAVATITATAGATGGAVLGDNAEASHAAALTRTLGQTRTKLAAETRRADDAADRADDAAKEAEVASLPTRLEDELFGAEDEYWTMGGLESEHCIAVGGGDTEYACTTLTDDAEFGLLDWNYNVSLDSDGCWTVRAASGEVLSRRHARALNGCFGDFADSNSDFTLTSL